MIELPFSISYCLPQVFIPRDTEVVLFKLIEKQTRFVMLIEKSRKLWIVCQPDNLPHVNVSGLCRSWADQTINDNKIWTMELHRWIKGVTQLLTLQLKFSLKSRRFCLPRFFVEGFNSATLLLNAKNQQLLNSRIVLHALATAQAQLNLFWYRSISWSISGKIKRYFKTGLYFHTCITSLYWVFLRECGAFFLWQATNQYG